MGHKSSNSFLKAGEQRADTETKRTRVILLFFCFLFEVSAIPGELHGTTCGDCFRLYRHWLRTYRLDPLFKTLFWICGLIWSIWELRPPQQFKKKREKKKKRKKTTEEERKKEKKKNIWPQSHHSGHTIWTCIVSRTVVYTGETNNNYLSK